MEKVYRSAPVGFLAEREVAGCFFEYGDKILMLKRASKISQGGTWCIPAGKLEAGETPREAVIREANEEVGVAIEKDLKEVGKLYIQLPHISYIFHLFSKRFVELPQLTLALDECSEAGWFTLDEAKKLPLIYGGLEALDYFR